MALASDGSIWLRHRYDAGIDRLEVSGDRIVRATAVVPADPKTAEGTAFHGFDAFGNFWRGSTNGVAVLHGNTWTTFTTEDGLVSNDCDGEAFWADADGGVWLGTSGGLAHYRSRKRSPTRPADCLSHNRATGDKPADPANPGGVFFLELQGRATGAVRLPAGPGALDRLGGAEHLHQRAGTRQASPGSTLPGSRRPVLPRDRSSGVPTGTDVERDLVGSSAGSGVCAGGNHPIRAVAPERGREKAGGVGGDRSRPHDKLEQSQPFVGRQSSPTPQKRRSPEECRAACACRSLGLGRQGQPIILVRGNVSNFRRAAGLHTQLRGICPSGHTPGSRAIGAMGK